MLSGLSFGDWKGERGIDPGTPPKEWFWNAAIDNELLIGDRDLYVCLLPNHGVEYLREREYKNMRRYPWGTIGGFPKLDAYSRFVQAVAKRYKGKISLWEIDNEPNINGIGDHPEDYAAVCKATYDNLKAEMPQSTVYGFSAPGAFTPFIKKVFDAGGAKSMDSVSFHTYTTPLQPDEARRSTATLSTNQLHRQL
jgi:hypothetical protein